MPPTKRTKTGCTTCRIRKVKCDESKPECLKCISGGRKCGGYSSLPFSRQDLEAACKSSKSSQLAEGGWQSLQDVSVVLYQLVNDPAFNDVLEKRSFSFFRHRTVASCTQLMDARFWDRVVLQVAHHEPAVKHGVLALSSWHQCATSNDDLALTSRKYADRQYHLALEHAQKLVASAGEQDIDRVLIACVVFVLYETARSNHRASALHLNNGRKIMRENSAKLRQSSRRSDLAEIQHALGRLDLIAGVAADRTAPYMCPIEEFLETNPILAPWAFKDVFEARNCLFDLGRWFASSWNHMVRAFLNGDMDTFLKYQAERERCIPPLQEWYQRFEPVARNADESNALLVLTLHVWYVSALIFTLTNIIRAEMEFDNCLEHFETLVSLGEQIVERLSRTEENGFSYELGYTTNMFLAAYRCRDPSIRRRAVKVMRAIPRLENRFPSTTGAVLAELIIELEEDGQEIKAAEDIPEWRRVCYVDVETRMEDGLVNVELWTRDAGTTDFTVHGTVIPRDPVCPSTARVDLPPLQSKFCAQKVASELAQYRIGIGGTKFKMNRYT